MDFIYDIYLVTGLVRSVVSPLTEVSDIVNASVTGGINLNHIQSPALGYCLTNGASVARFALAIGKAVHRLSQNTAGAGFAGAPGTTKKIGVSYAFTTEGVT